MAGRDALIERAAIALDRIRAGRYDKSLILVGLRGVGKTVLLNRVQLDAETEVSTACAWRPRRIARSGYFGPAMRASLLKLDRARAVPDTGKKAMRALAGFVRAMRIKFADAEWASTWSPRRPRGSGDLDIDLTDLLLSVGEPRATDPAHSPSSWMSSNTWKKIVSLFDYCPAPLRPEAASDHPSRAGLPQIVGQTGRAKSYAERLFDFPEVGPLDDAAARLALTVPAQKEGVSFDPAALDEILQQTRGYPYFLQEWGKHSWSVAPSSPITADHVRIATIHAMADLDASFFRVRFDRLTPAEKNYLRAMATLDPALIAPATSQRRLAERSIRSAPCAAH